MSQPKSRPSRQDIMMAFAHSIAQRSTCRRRQVGVVIADSNLVRVHAIGYNGSGRGMPNECDSPEPGRCGCIHAEVNALVKCQTSEPVVLLTTTAPCRMCAKLILNSNVHTVVFADTYRDKSGIELLREHAITVIRYVPGE